MEQDKNKIKVKSVDKNTKNTKNLTSSKTIFFHAFWKKMRTDKFFLFSFIVTCAFIGIASTRKVNQAKGMIEEAFVAVEKNVVTEQITSEDTTNKETTSTTSAELTDYVGIYSKKVTLDTSLSLNDKCLVNEYKIIYEITSDNNIKKLFYNSCIGTVELWSTTAEYKTENKTKYISANGIQFEFTQKQLREIKNNEKIDYNLDKEITELKPVIIIEDVNMYFYGENIVFLKTDDLILLSNGQIKYKASDKFKNNGGSLNGHFYKSEDQYEYRFIIFENGEDKDCYEETEGIEDGPLYTIYSIKYDNLKEEMISEEKLISRSKLNSCPTLEEDLELLKQ